MLALGDPRRKPASSCASRGSATEPVLFAKGVALPRIPTLNGQPDMPSSGSGGGVPSERYR